ncbi:auxin-responsive protein IAA19-like [Miscanthus floridulus]|uniref:auxin-responsive protein IAA19-like n=1 Tax=Miscanthus floridulus TaxID=154761 RepID=UPI003457F8CE
MAYALAHKGKATSDVAYNPEDPPSAYSNEPIHSGLDGYTLMARVVHGPEYNLSTHDLDGEVVMRAGGGKKHSRAQVVGWPPVRSYRKNTLAASATKTKGGDEGRSEAGCCYVKVSMDGAPYLRKVDLKTYSSYEDLSLGLEKMFSCFITGQSSSRKTSRRERLTDGSRADALQDQEYVLTYEDKDVDWMLVGDLPWE